jgi:hypothetical protein
MKKSGLLGFLLASLMLGLCLSAWATDGSSVPPENPYVGVIRNYTKTDVEVPSLNSMGTITVPAKGWVEYRVWTEQFDLIGYVNGKPFYCQKVKVDPDKYQLFCKTYDFVAEIKKDEAAPAKKVRKKRIKRKKPTGQPVEGLG